MKYVTLFLLLVALSCSSDTAGNGDNQQQNNANNQNDASDDAINNVADVTVDARDDAGEDAASEDTGPDFDPNAPFGGERPARVVLPSNYDAANRYPLVFLLHGYTGTAAVQDTYLGLSSEVDARDFILVLPDGVEDGLGNQYWNATTYCCGFGTDRVDDLTYLTGLLDEAEARYSIDPSRVYFIGHSNGGFMSYTLACEIGDRIAAIASLAGTTHVDAGTCSYVDEVSILQIHGTLDTTIQYGGAANQFPGAVETVNRWVTNNGCGAGVAGADFDLDTVILGDETTVESWGGCTDDADVTLWTIQGGSHIPGVSGTFAPAVLDHLLQRTKN